MRKALSVCWLVASLLAILTSQPILAWNNPGLYILLGSLILVWSAISGKLNPRLYGGVIVGTCLVVFGGTAPFLSGFAVDARKQLSGVLTAETQASLPVLDETQVPLVSSSVALTAMKQKLGEDLGLASQFEMGTPVKQVVKGRLVWAAPLEPRSPFKALFGDTSPAYAVVDASDANSAKLVKTNIDISDREFFDLDTRVWFKNPTLNVYAWFFELDEEGKPYWVGVLVDRKVGFRGYDVEGVLILDVNSGHQTRYSVQQAPSWVDNKFPQKLVADQIDVAGDLVNGWFNPTDDGKFQLSAGLDMVYANGKAWYLGTLSSVAQDEAITEGVLVDTQTKAMTRFALQGITEKSAGQKLEGQNPEKKLMASNPVPYMVNGTPAYVAALADRNDVVRAYGVIAVNAAQVLAVSETLNAAVKQFSTKSGRAQADLGGESTSRVISGTVTVIRQDVATQQYFLLVDTGTEKVIAVAPPYISDEVHVTTPGNVVKLKVKQSAQANAVIEFDNTSL